MDIDKEPLPTRLDTTEDPPRIKRWDVRTNTWAEDGVLNAMARALRIAAAALHALPGAEHRLGAEHRTVTAAALATIQAAVAMAEGRPFDPDNSDLMNLLRRSRDSIDVLLRHCSEPEGAAPRNSILGVVRQTYFDLCSMIGAMALDPAEELMVDGDRSVAEPAGPGGKR